MGSWLRVNASRQRHHRFVRGGFWCGVVVEAAWEISKDQDLSGTIPAGYWEAEYLASWVNLLRDPYGVKDPLDCIRHGMQRAQEVGLVDYDGDNYALHDWAQWQPDSRNAAKQKRYRDRSALRNVTVTRGNAEQRSVTLPNVTRDGTDGTGQDFRSARACDPSSSSTDKATELDQALAATEHCKRCFLPFNPDLANPVTWSQLKPGWAQALLTLRGRGASWKGVYETASWIEGDGPKEGDKPGWGGWQAVVVDVGVMVDNWTKIRAAMQRKQATRASVDVQELEGDAWTEGAPE
ncbi:MAG: hypothetical protein GY835_23755 [bacterium]|nr:hypothetical protein [bacterium]